MKHDHTGMTWATERGADGKPLRPVVSAGVDRGIRATADLFFWASLWLAALGLWRSRLAERPGPWLLPLTLAYFFGLHMVMFVGDPRFHAVLYPVLAVLMAVATAPRPASVAEVTELA